MEADRRRRERDGDTAVKEDQFFSLGQFAQQAQATSAEVSAMENTRAYLLLERSELGMQNMQAKLDCQMVALQMQQEILERILREDQGEGGETGSTTAFKN